MLLPIGEAQPLYRFTMYLSARDCFGEAVKDVERWVQEACFILTSICGGATRIPAFGLWYNKIEGLLIEEPCTIVYSNVRPRHFLSNFHLIEDFVTRFGRETMQETVMLEYGQQLYFVSEFSSPQEESAEPTCPQPATRPVALVGQ